jgi:predicted permease
VFRRSPSFALAAILCLALGIGANTTMFSLAMEILFSEPSCREPESLVQISAGGNSWMPMEQYRFLRDAQVLDGLAGLNIGMVANWRSTDRSYRLAATRVTDNFFEVTGIPIAMGRPIGRGEQDVTIITYGFWQQRLGADPNVLGRKLILDGQPYSIVGVLPREHRMLVGFGFTPDLYLTKDPVEVMVYGRLARGMGRQAARARLEPICRELDRVYPDANHKWAKDIKTSAVSGMERLTQQGMGAAMPLAAFFSMLVIVTGLVLLIACANVCSLLLARAFERSRELAVRMSLGGSRGRIVRQLLAESLLLAICGTSAGLLLNFWLTGLLRGVRIPTPLAIELLIQPDRRLLLYSIGIALGVTVAAGLVPAIRGTQMGISAVLKGHQGQAGSRRWTLRDALVAAQLAVSVLLLAGGFLFVNNLIRASAFDAGFDTEHTIVASVWAVPELCTPNRFARLSDAGVERLRALAGVESVSLARAVPLDPFLEFTRDGGVIGADTSDRAVYTRYNSNAAGRRTREIGIRVALGATPASILRMVARDSASLVAVGLAIGLGISYFAVRPLALFLVPGVRPADPLNFVTAAFALALVAVVASISPALRALRIDPAVALRRE